MEVAVEVVEVEEVAMMMLKKQTSDEEGSSSSSIRPSRFASGAPMKTQPPHGYSFWPPPAPGAALERIAARAEGLRKPGGGVGD